MHGHMPPNLVRSPASKLQLEKRVEGPSIISRAKTREAGVIGRSAQRPSPYQEFVIVLAFVVHRPTRANRSIHLAQVALGEPRRPGRSRGRALGEHHAPGGFLVQAMDRIRAKAEIPFDHGEYRAADALARLRRQSRGFVDNENFAVFEKDGDHRAIRVQELPGV